MLPAVLLISVALYIVAADADYCRQSDRRLSNQDDDSQFVVISVSIPTGLKRFATWFDQDCGLEFGSFREGAAMYLNTLSDPDRAVLRVELEEFLNAQRGQNRDQLRHAWSELGAVALFSDLGWEALYEVLGMI